ncbi:patatin-like phospholipase family protein [Melioribacteraceae bacterium 4301-Me]|uniref:patatin-like phospholipase family protein n=1 Tax=Pyranulibacter aquaticus TaxID=3163344 RepID=UPI00359860E2
MSKFGLALGGGGARGLAHIGVLKVLDEENIKIHSITGCSMGALVGGLYAYYGNAKEVEEFIYKAMKHPKFIELGTDKLKENNKPDKSYFERFFDYVETRIQALRALNRLSYFNEELTNEIYQMIPDVPIENLKIKYSAIATDLLSGEEVNFTRGSLRQVIKASSAIPGIFPPVRLDNYFLIDGSASESVPAGRVREIGADRVLGVDVTRCIKTIEQPQNVFEILYRAEDITSFHLSVLRLREADLVIRPQVRHLTWADFGMASEIIAAGEKAARENITEIKKLVNRNSFLLGLKHYIKKLKGNA